MTKRVDWRYTLLAWAAGMLLMIAFVPHARSSCFEEHSTAGLEPHTVALSDLPRTEFTRISGNLRIFGELVERLDILDESDSPTSFVAALHEVTVASAAELVFGEPAASDDEAKAETFLAINSEASESCRATGVARSAYNYGAVAEAECTCELYQRNPAARFSNATSQEFHWVKSCKKARYKAS